MDALVETFENLTSTYFYVYVGVMRYVAPALVLLLLLLCGTNFYNIPGGLTWAAVPCIFVGGILAAPVAILQLTPSILGEFASFAPMINVLAVNHYAAPIIGLVLLIGSIIWRIVRSCIRNSQ